MEDNQKKKSSAPFIAILFIIAIAGSCFGGWYYGRMDADEAVTQKTECEKELKEVKTESTVDKAKCYGTYTEDGTQGNVKWILEEDGTYKIEGKETTGAFFIKDNTITFIEKKHTVGPEDKDPYYTSPKAYLISKDCEKITLASGDTGAGLTKQD